MHSSKQIYHANQLDHIDNYKAHNNHPYVVRMTSNNGVRGYITKPEEFLNEGNTLSFAQDTFTVYYQKDPFFTGNKVKVLKPLFDKKSTKIMRFFVACLQRALEPYSWGVGSTVTSILDTSIKVPSQQNGEIDFDFMESFVAELEAERVAELTAYLKVSGLDNYELSKEEKELIGAISNIEFKGFDITDIFEIYNTHNILSRDIVEGSGTTPYLCASAENNSISSYISYQNSFKENGNCIFIGGKTFVVTYQKDDFFSNDSHNLALYLKDAKVNRLNQLFLVTCIYKSLSHKYSWGDSVSKTKIKKDVLFLPVTNGKPDYELMDRLIPAIQKLVIKDVVQYADKKITATKEIVSNTISS